MNDQDLRDCFAMFALTGLITHTPYDAVVDVHRYAYQAYNFADAMLEARDNKNPVGLPPIRRKTRAK